MNDYGIHWFRRDLRLAGNPALQLNWKKNRGKVVGLFCFDKVFLARPDFSINRFQFFLETLNHLREEMRSVGSDLLILDTGPVEALQKLQSLWAGKKLSPPRLVTWNRDYEPFAQVRDNKIRALLEGWSVPWLDERDHCVIEPMEIFKGENSEEGYQVFTPFSRKWLENFSGQEVQGRIEAQRRGLTWLATPHKEPFFDLTWRQLLGEHAGELPDVFADYLRANQARVSVPIPESGSVAVLKTIEEFRSKLKTYGESRDFPAIAGTSRFSLFFKNGSLTVAQVIASLGLKSGAGGGAQKFLTELIWREFYYHILGRHPRVEHESFQERYANLRWENREDWFAAWQQGQTGFPIVDAGMRELLQTGWMHNRVRMIVASFLTKDLLIDWRWGEAHFMHHLLDGDLAPNNGGWQWAASTGCDAQPYFRIFNPVLQSKKFDPQGEYIRRFVPELRHLDAKQIHEPAPLDRGRYPQPIVEHSVQREKALQLYQVG